MKSYPVGSDTVVLKRFYSGPIPWKLWPGNWLRRTEFINRRCDAFRSPSLIVSLVASIFPPANIGRIRGWEGESRGQGVPACPDGIGACHRWTNVTGRQTCPPTEPITGRAGVRALTSVFLFRDNAPIFWLPSRDLTQCGGALISIPSALFVAPLSTWPSWLQHRQSADLLRPHTSNSRSAQQTLTLSW